VFGTAAQGPGHGEYYWKTYDLIGRSAVRVRCLITRAWPCGHCGSIPTRLTQASKLNFKEHRINGLWNMGLRRTSWIGNTDRPIWKQNPCCASFVSCLASSFHDLGQTAKAFLPNRRIHDSNVRSIVHSLLLPSCFSIFMEVYFTKHGNKVP